MSSRLANGVLVETVVKTRRPLIINSNMEQRLERPNPKSWLGVPIIINEEVVGGFTIQNWEREHAFNDSNVRLLQTLAGSLGVALENARLFKAEQERVAELGIINAVQGALAAELDFQGIYEAVGEKLREIFNYQDVSIYTADLKAHTMTVEYTFEKGQRLEQVTVPMNSLYEHIVKTNKTLVFNGNGEEFAAQFTDYEVPSGEFPKSLLIVSVHHKKGATRRTYLTLQDVDGKTIFTNSHVRLLETLANSMSIALQNAQSFKAEQERVAELQIINSIQQGLAAELNFQAIVDLVGDKLREVFNTGDFGIRWYDEKTNLVHFLYEYEHGVRLDIPPASPNPGGTFDLFLKDRQPIVANTPELAARTGGTIIDGTDMSKSIIAVPIITSDRLTGSLQIENYERENAYGKSELRLLTTIAASLGTALENAASL